jgi:hypothetical protein
MTKKVKVILNWDGPYEDPNAVPKRAGMYMVIAGSKLSNGSFSTSSYEVLDIGQSGETGVRLDTECNEGYKREDSVIIINKGNRTPLKEEYSCG